MLERWKKQLFSEDGMKVVNVLFILLYLVRNPLFTICAYTVWFVYLVYSARSYEKRNKRTGEKNECLKGIFCENI